MNCFVRAARRRMFHMFIIIIDALELNHIHLHRRGAGKERKAEIGLNGKSREVMTYTVKLY